MINKIKKYLKGYIERNDTIDEFVYDINTLGGTFEDGWIQCTKKDIEIQDKNFETIFKVKIIEIWKNEQMTLF